MSTASHKGEGRTHRTEVDDDGNEYEVYSEEEDDEDGDEDGDSYTPDDTTKPSNSGTSQKAPAKKDTHKNPENVPGAVPTPLSNTAPPDGKNPFTTSFVWNKDNANLLTATVDRITSKDETTNDLTREKNPENRHWKKTVEFSYRNYKSITIRLENILLPFSDSRNYGNGYVYMALPVWLREKVLTACKATRPTVADDPSLSSNAEQWWKTVNFKGTVAGRMKKLAGESKFVPTPLDTIFKSSGRAIMAAVVLKIHLKVTTHDKKPLASTDPGKIAIDADRIYLRKLKIDAPPAPRVARQRIQAAPPPAFKKDLESEELANDLAELGL